MKQALIIFSLLIESGFSHGQIITTIAGNGDLGHVGDGGQAAAASIGYSNGVAVDKKGNIFICDGNSCIRKVNPAGIITTIAGNNTAGYGGDGGPATAATLNMPTGIAVDIEGNIFVADRQNNRIRKIDTSGIITTIAGDGVQGFGGDDGPAVIATLYKPHGVTVDDFGNVFITDQGNNRVRKINSLGIITTVAGNGVGGYLGDGVSATSTPVSSPFYVVLDKIGNMYISDGTADQRIRKVNTSGIISTIAGNGVAGFSGDTGPATGAEMHQVGVAIDNAGNLYIADYYNNRIRKVAPNGVITTVAGNGIAGFSGDNGPALNAELYKPYDLTVDSAGAIYVADVFNTRIRRISSTLFENGVGKNEHQFRVYPNPCKKTFCINIPSSVDEQAQLTIVDLAGRMVMTKSVITNRNQEIRLTVPSGVYLLCAVTAADKSIATLIVE